MNTESTSENLINSVLDSLITHVAVLDHNGFIILVNKAWEKFSKDNGWCLNCGVGMNYIDVCRKASLEISDAGKALQGISDVLNRKSENFSMEYSCHSPSEKRWFLMHVTSLDNGGVTVSHTNITPDKLIEEKLIEHEKFFRSLIQNSTDVVVLMDKDWRLKYVSPSVEKVTGYSVEERLNSSGIDFLHPDDLHFVRQSSKEMMERGMFKPIEIRAKHKTKGWIWTEVIASNYLDDPALNGFVINYRDIDDRKKAQEALLKYEKELKEVNESKDKLFSIISHDLRSPFHSLLGLSEFIMNETDTLEKEEIKSIASHLYDATLGLYSLVEDLLQWSRFKTGKIVYTPEVLNFKELAETAIAIHEINASKKLLKINLECESSLSVFADNYMADTILRNLISNSIKFSIGPADIKVKALQKNNMVEVSVADTGVGIEEERLNKIFSLGEKISTTGTANERGTGLGLALCKEFIEINKGTISIYSKPGKGTNVVVTLPPA